MAMFHLLLYSSLIARVTPFQNLVNPRENLVNWGPRFAPLVLQDTRRKPMRTPEDWNSIRIKPRTSPQRPPWAFPPPRQGALAKRRGGRGQKGAKGGAAPPALPAAASPASHPQGARASTEAPGAAPIPSPNQKGKTVPPKLNSGWTSARFK